MISGLYASKLPAGLLEKWPVETRANCGSCNMAVPHQDIYKPNLKCCTYMPFLPQFSVGEIVQKNSAGILKGLGNKILTPLGLCPSPNYQLKHRTKNALEFGRREDLACSFLNDGQCSIWQLRNSHCSTFYCESSYGEEGQEYLSLVREFLHHFELSLSQNLMVEKGYDWEEVEEVLEWVKIPILSAEYDGLEELSEEQNRGLWKHWFGKEIQYYLESLEVYLSWSWEDIKLMLDPESLLLLERIQEKKIALSEGNNVSSRAPAKTH